MKKLAFGLMRLPLTDTNDVTSIDVERVKTMADEYMKAGFNYFDTATPYHGQHSEVAFRKAVAERYPREDYWLVDKLSLWMTPKQEDLQPFFDGQLERLGVDYLDLYLMHAMDAARFEQANEMGAFDFMKKLKEEGKIRHIGFSFHDTADVLERMLAAWPEMEYVQLQMNYLDWEDEQIQARKCYEVAKKFDKKILVMEPIRGGSLATVSPVVEKLFKDYNPNISIASWAVRFVASLENVVMVLSGMSDEAQMADNISYMTDFQPLSAEELAIVEKAAEIIRNDIAIKCTACRYCVDDCPMNIPIPDYFKVYNSLKQLQHTKEADRRQDYKNLSKDHGLASACIECGMCEGHCPQNLPVRDWLKKVVADLE